MMLRRTSSWVVHYAFRQRVRTLVREAIGFAIFISGLAVIAEYLLRRVSDG
jgi:hypothetical protein